MGDDGHLRNKKRVNASALSPSSQVLAVSGFQLLPAEVRLQIWSCAVEPRVVILEDVLQRSESYPLPPVAQLNYEARAESRKGYEPIGRGSYFNFARDILVCDASISDHEPSRALADLAPRIQRLAFWDCFPDDSRVLKPQQYFAYVTACCQQRHFGEVEFNKFLFPNLKDLWIIKVGELDRSWSMAVDHAQPYSMRLKKSARQFRYWIDEGIIEIAPLDLDDPEIKAVLRDGRCGKNDCQELNQSRHKTISKIMFIDGQYRRSDDTKKWARILPWSEHPERGRETVVQEDRMRWFVVERALTFSLRFETDEGAEEAASSLAARQVHHVL